MTNTSVAELIERARTDKEFRARAVANLDSALAEEGYELSEDELQAAKALQQQAKGMSDEAIDAALADEVTGHAS